MQATADKGSSPLKQPGAVWAVAFACVISFMGIGLVDPILPALSQQLQATPAQVSLLFTSYLLVTAVAMIGVNWVSSRIGAKRTLVLGLVVIVVFAALAGNAGSIGGIVGFRAGWGLGNALFITTSLSVIVASASGGFSGAIILYEAALGIGIAVGPLLGGLLGNISWRGPFYGVAALMAIALIATAVFVQPVAKAEKPVSLLAPLAALKHRGLLTMGVMAFLYNWGFFTLLGYAPYPMKIDALHLGFVFTGWGLLVAIFAVFGAPRLQRRFGTVPVLYANLAALGVILGVIALNVDSPTTVIVAVILTGACIGINNTLTTQAVMLVSPVERSVASSAYGFVRFIGGGLAPFVAGKIAEAAGEPAAFAVGAAAFVLAIVVLASGHRLVRAAEAQETVVEQVSPTLEPIGERHGLTTRPVLVAVDGSAFDDEVIERAASIAAREGAPLELVHVLETEVSEEASVDAESSEHARALVSAHLERLARRGVPVQGLVLASVGDHAAAGRVLADHADHVDARLLVLGRSRSGILARFTQGSVNSEITKDPTRSVLVVGDSIRS